MRALPEIEANVPLAPLTTLGVGGPARHLARPRTPDELRGILAWTQERNLPVFVLGQGSNVVFADEGFSGLVLQVDVSGTSWRPEGDRVRVRAGAGDCWDDLVAQAVARDLSGIECLSGIPGRVGAAPIQNIGAYGQELSQRFVRAQALDARTLEEVVLDSAACRFGYRSSLFKTDQAGPRLIVMHVELDLEVPGRPEIRYEELARKLSAKAVSDPRPADVRAAVLELRRTKSMVVDPADPLSRSAGSFFLNPLLSLEERLAAEERGRATGALSPGQELHTYAQSDGSLKASAAWLIERAGFHKGYRRGAVGLSARHALAIVNHGGARACEVVALAREIRDGVRSRFGITLTPEPALVGLTLD